MARGESDVDRHATRDVRPLIIDGGLATGLEELGFKLHPRLWSAGVFLEEPRAVEQLHRLYLDAGAEILITASYQMSFAGLAREGLTHEAAASAMQRTVDTARAAAAQAGVAALVAASVGPFGASLADGSEYRGDYGIGAEELRAFHRERLARLAGAGPDLLACETIPSLAEVEVLCGLLDESPGPPAWLSLTCRDGARLSDGRAVTLAAALAEKSPRIRAIGVNCTAPEHVGPLLRALRGATAKPLLAYPNSGESWDAARRSWHGAAREELFLELAGAWAAAGAWAIGGCCRVGPRQVRALAERLAPQGRVAPSVPT